MNSKKKILFFHHTSVIGGASLSGLNVLNAVPKDQYDIFVYCNTYGGEMSNIFEKAGFKVINAYKSPTSLCHFSGSNIFALSFRALLNYIMILIDYKRISSIIPEVNPDIVIVNSMTLFWIGKIAKKANKETICFFRETYTKGLFGIRTSIIKYFLNKNFDKISFISQYDLEQNKVLKCNKRIIYNAVNSEDYKTIDKNIEKKKLGLNLSDFNTLFVGGMLPLKGASIAIQALSQTKNDKIVLAIVGYNWNGKKKKFNDCKNWKEKVKYIFQLDYEKQCTDFIIKHRLYSQIKFYPPNDNIYSFYHACDCLVFPATKPHQARPIFEAALSRIPVIISDFQNIRESINENSGYLFENKNIKQLAFIMNKLAKEPSIAKNKIDTNYDNSINKNTLQVFNKQIIELLSSVKE